MITSMKDSFHPAGIVGCPFALDLFVILGIVGRSLIGEKLQPEAFCCPIDCSQMLLRAPWTQSSVGASAHSDRGARCQRCASGSRSASFPLCIKAGDFGILSREQILGKRNLPLACQHDARRLSRATFVFEKADTASSIV